MANVSGSESDAGSPGDRNEFIELYTFTDTNINILRYSVSDGDAKDNLKLFPDSLPHPGGITSDSIIPPHSYIVIFDPEYSTVGDSMFFMPYKIPDDAYVFTISTTTFGENGLSANDILYLLDENDSTVDIFGTPFIEDNFPYDPGDGISLEKVNFSYPDSPNSFKPSVDSSGNTIGKVNSVFVEGSLIDSVVTICNGDICNIRVFLSYLKEYDDNLIAEYETRTDTILIDSSVVEITVENEEIINLHTQSSEKFFTVLTKNAYNPGSIVLNEFMVKGNEWIELYNPHSLPFYLHGVSMVNSEETISIEDGKIEPLSFIIVSGDTAEVKSEYYNIHLNLLECDLFSLPDREDTILLFMNKLLLDSVIRGYENLPYSIERIAVSVPGFQRDNWDECIDFMGATPCLTNSIKFELERTGESIYAVPDIITPSSPNLFLTIKLAEHKGVVNVKIYDDLGCLIEQPVTDRQIKSEETIFIKRLGGALDDGLYMLFITVDTEEKRAKHILKFAVRNN
ncbi:MAG: hypothetical protein AB7T10_01315 [bacterium]